jgi:hypothetical protein
MPDPPPRLARGGRLAAAERERVAERSALREVVVSWAANQVASPSATGDDQPSTAGQPNVQVGHHPQQLALALGERLAVKGQHVLAIPGASTRCRRLRDARGRFVAGAAGAVKPRRVRALPSRDGRGRFVAYPTSNAPSWYVFCCDGYRIPEDRQAPPPPPISPAARHALPHAIARPRRAWLTRSYLENAILFVLFVIAAA